MITTESDDNAHPGDSVAADLSEFSGGDIAQGIEHLYSPAMLADLLGVSVRVVRRWRSVSLLSPAAEVMQLPYFDYASLTIARQLAQWAKQGISVHSVCEQLKAFQERMGDPSVGLHQLIELLPIRADGKRLVLREGDHLLESSGQLRMAFDDVELDEAVAATLRFEKPESSSRGPAVDSAGDMSLEAMVETATMAEDDGDYDTAVDWYRAALAAHGPSAEVCFQLAELLYRQGDIPGARERYFISLELNPTLVEARANLGCVLAECGQLTLAIAAFEGTLEQYPDYADVHFHLARALDDSDHATQAAEHWVRFLELAPESPWADEARDRLKIATPILDI